MKKIITFRKTQKKDENEAKTSDFQQMNLENFKNRKKRVKQTCILLILNKMAA